MKTKKPGARRQYGDRESIRLLLPVDLIQYIDSVTINRTQWLIEAVKEKIEREKLLNEAVQEKLQREHK